MTSVNASLEKDLLKSFLAHVPGKASISLIKEVQSPAARYSTIYIRASK